MEEEKKTIKWSFTDTEAAYFESNLTKHQIPSAKLNFVIQKLSKSTLNLNKYEATIANP